MSLDNCADALIKKLLEVRKKQRSENGKFRVLGVDKFDNEDWIHGEYDTAKEAVEEARRMTTNAKKDAFGDDPSSIATVYYAYSPDGKYLGGDTWTKK